MPSAADHIADHLAAEGVGEVASQLDWGIYVGSEPAAPTNCITVYDTGGSFDNPDGGFESPSVQVRIRAAVYSDGVAKAEAIKAALLPQTSRTLGAWHYTGVWLESDLTKIGRSDDGQELLVMNFRAMREPV